MTPPADIPASPMDGRPAASMDGRPSTHETPAQSALVPGDCRIVSCDSQVAMLALEGEADLFLAERLKSVLADGAGESEVVLVDMSECSFIDSSIIATLLGAARAGERRTLALVAPTQAPRRVLEISGAVDYVPVFDSVEAARDTLSRPASPA
ncbi:MAG: hypothetical protein K0S35_3128 [Geminicoccaceae bacterium]|nr:hypothetical protein [Geminicoccaceae bacterium]